MHHVSDDRRMRRSAERIWQALLACMERRRFEDVTVTDICRECGVARTTFYRCFDNTADILEWKCDDCFHKALDSYHPERFGGELDLARHYFTYWMEHDDILNLLVRIGRQDIIYTCHLRNADILAGRYGTVPGLPPEHANYFMAIRTGFTIGILTAWIENGRKENTEELLAIMQEQILLLNNDVIRRGICESTERKATDRRESVS